MLSTNSRRLTYLLALLYAMLGVILFFAPHWAAPHFAWKVSVFVTMTIGAWCLGNAWLAWITARRWQWPRVGTALLYLWLFGILEALVAIEFRDKLRLEHPVADLYLVTLAVNIAAAAWGIVDWVRNRPAESGPPDRFGATLWVLMALFVVAVGFLGVYGLSVKMGGRGTNGTIFPEIMSLFTLRSFAAFYLTISLSTVPVLWTRRLDTVAHHAWALYGLVMIIPIAALVFIDLFNFAEHPLSMLYIGAYVVVAIGAGVIAVRYGGIR